MIKSIAALAMLAFTAPAFAGGVTVAQDGDSKLKIGAKFYVDMSASKTEDQTGTTNKTIGANLGRAYFSVGYKFNDVWSMGLTTDVAVAPANSNLKKRSTVYIKKAYLQGKFAPEFVLQAGVIGTPWIGHEEHLWKHRYLSKVMLDTLGFDSSADAGIGIKGKVADGLLNYHITEINGGGYGNISKSDGMDLNARIGLKPVDGLTLDGQFRDGYWGKKTFGAAAPQKNRLWQILATYGMGHDFRVGAGYINFDDKQGLKGSKVANTKNNAYYLWGWVNFADNYGAFARYETLKAKNVAWALNENQIRYVAGLDWHAYKNVEFSLAYDYSKKTDIKGVAGTFTKDTKYGIFSQVKF
ncbi:MAG: hypothetical protein D6678_06720 [Zetaproteobacteria bacterium]|nr:MAG: hypothetical protein D6678_06720 [Zetaproteobacteria bacterium]